jgi:hypothetical protein
MRVVGHINGWFWVRFLDASHSTGIGSLLEAGDHEPVQLRGGLGASPCDRPLESMDAAPRVKTAVSPGRATGRVLRLARPPCAVRARAATGVRTCLD